MPTLSPACVLARGARAVRLDALADQVEHHVSHGTDRVHRTDDLPDRGAGERAVLRDRVMREYASLTSMNWSGIGR